MIKRQVEYEMGYTLTEFGRVLEGNFSGEKSVYHAARHNTDHWLLGSKDSDIGIELSLHQQLPRKLGHFTLPVLIARFSISASSADEIDLFFDKFFKYFHKGGG